MRIKLKEHSRCAKWWLVIASVSVTISMILLIASIINHIITNIK